MEIKMNFFFNFLTFALQILQEKKIVKNFLSLSNLKKRLYSKQKKKYHPEKSLAPL